VRKSTFSRLAVVATKGVLICISVILLIGCSLFQSITQESIDYNSTIENVWNYSAVAVGLSGDSSLIARFTHFQGRL
jgi:hypothetical protein